MVRIVDFGISCSLLGEKGKKFASTFCGSSGYMAPEVFDKKYTFSSDVFGFGALMYLLIFKRSAFPIDSIWDYEKAMNDKIPVDVPDELPGEISELLRSMLSFKPDERPDFITICTVLKKEIDSIMEQQENE